MAMPRGREPEGQTALTNAERQARYRARRQAPRPPLSIEQRRPARRSRTKRWNDALAEMLAGPGRVRRVVRGPAWKPARQRHGGGAAGHNRSWPGRDRRGSAAAWLRPWL